MAFTRVAERLTVEVGNSIDGSFVSDGWRSGFLANRGRIGIASAVLKDRTPAAPAVEPEPSTVTWGGPSNFDWGQAEDFANGPNIRFKSRDRENEDEEVPYQDIEQWEEVARTERDVRIEGTNGAYVDFKRLDEITWRLPDLNGVQRFVVQRFKHFGDE